MDMRFEECVDCEERFHGLDIENYLIRVEPHGDYICRDECRGHDTEDDG